MIIGLFDSGVGGLTVLRELKNELHGVEFIYLGDTARLPYGNKAPETLRQYTNENLKFLDDKKVGAVVVACHSASSVVLGMEKSPAGAPLFNVIGPSCDEAIKSSATKKVGVLATKATTRSRVYPNYIEHLAPDIQVFSQEAPLLVPLVEEALLDDPITRLAIERYLTPMKNQGVDTIILGCTHYPILQGPIADFCGPHIRLIDPARSVAQVIKQQLKWEPGSEGLKVFLTDHSPHFIAHGKSLLGDMLESQILHP